MLKHYSKVVKICLTGEIYRAAKTSLTKDRNEYSLIGIVTVRKPPSDLRTVFPL